MAQTDHKIFIEALRAFMRLPPLYNIERPWEGPWTLPSSDGHHRTPTRAGSDDMNYSFESKFKASRARFMIRYTSRMSGDSF